MPRSNALSALKARRFAASAGYASRLAQIARLTGLSDGKGDSLHRLVMDLHKALNRLSAAHAEEVLAGAHVYGLLPQDRPAVEAFMRGVESTRKLKFDHPGLATTATRVGRAAHHPERYRRDRRACGRDRGRSRMR